MITALVVLLWVLFAYAILVGIGFLWKPKQQTALLGFIWGDLRLEDGNGNDTYCGPGAHLLLFTGPFYASRTQSWYVTHIQYRSRFGFMLTWPGCFHFWTQPRFQKTEPGILPPARIPGTELCIPYTRLPGWRDSSEGFVLTRGYFGFHLD